jgi:hypothetical protein
VTLVFERKVKGPASHAFVVGVGAYPFAKPDGPLPDRPPALYDVKDLPSAAAGARLFADWLIGHRDELPAPLASLRVLISDPTTPIDQEALYSWKEKPDLAAAAGFDPRNGAAIVGRATMANVQAEGVDWGKRVQEGTGENTAILYICGHGTAVPTRSFVLLEELAGLDAPYSPWEPFVDVQLLASRLQRIDTLKSGYVFVDACQEVVDPFIRSEGDPVAKVGEGVRFLAPPKELSSVNPKVLLLVPGPLGTLAFDDDQDGGGRFTHVLIEALSGAAARETSGSGSWAVFADWLPRAMQELYSLRWTDREFSPVPVHMPLVDSPVVNFGARRPIVPFRVALDPAIAMNSVERLWLTGPDGKDILDRTSLGEVWVDRVEVRQGLCSLNSTFPVGAEYAGTPLHLDLSQMRIVPIIVHRVAP